MELYQVMRTTFSAREFTNEPLTDEVLYRILDNARFAPSGGNRQGWRVLVIRDMKTRESLCDLTLPAAKRYMAQIHAGENPWNTVLPTSVDDSTIEATPAPHVLTDVFMYAALVLVVCVDLKVVASMDQYLDRIGVVSGASIYPFVWNILLAARNEGFGGTITTIPVSNEQGIKSLLGIPDDYAVSAVMPMGKPFRDLTKLTRNPVESFTTHEHWTGNALTTD